MLLLSLEYTVRGIITVNLIMDGQEIIARCTQIVNYVINQNQIEANILFKKVAVEVINNPQLFNDITEFDDISTVFTLMSSAQEIYVPEDIRTFTKLAYIITSKGIHQYTESIMPHKMMNLLANRVSLLEYTGENLLPDIRLCFLEKYSTPLLSDPFSTFDKEKKKLQLMMLADINRYIEYSNSSLVQTMTTLSRQPIPQHIIMTFREWKMKYEKKFMTYNDVMIANEGYELHNKLFEYLNKYQ
jgi:hypothetical protein